MSDHPKGADFIDRVLAVSVDPGDGSTPVSLQYVLVRGFAAMGWGQPSCAADSMAESIIALIDDPVRAAGPDLYSAASTLIAAIDGLQSITTAERIITGRSDASVRKVGNEAVAALRAAIAKAEAPADAEGGAKCSG